MSRLNLNENSAITGKGLQYLRSCKKLTRLKVAKGRIKADDLLVLKGMKFVSISLSGSKLKARDWSRLRAAFPQANFTDEDPVDSETKYVLGPIH